jgi:hypothetical protein
MGRQRKLPALFFGALGPLSVRGVGLQGSGELA